QPILERKKVLQGFLGKIEADRPPGKLRSRHYPPQGALEFADVGAYALGNEKRHLLRQHRILPGGLAHQNGNGGFEFRRIDGDRQSPTEARLQPFLKARDFLRVAIAGQHDLPLPLEEGIESMEKLFLGSFLSSKELDVIDQQR